MASRGTSRGPGSCRPDGFLRRFYAEPGFIHGQVAVLGGAVAGARVHGASAASEPVSQRTMTSPSGPLASWLVRSRTRGVRGWPRRAAFRDGARPRREKAPRDGAIGAHTPVGTWGRPTTLD